MPLPEPGTTPQNAVDFRVVQELALRKAQAEWPGCQKGPVVPYVDENGATVAYMFHFRTDGTKFPVYDQVRMDILQERFGLLPNTDIRHWRSKYGHILVSARSDRVPIPCYGYGASDYYAVGKKALARAREILGSDAMLSRMYFIFPGTFFEFSDNDGKQIIISSLFDQVWQSRQLFVNEIRHHQQELANRYGIDESEIARIHRNDWNKALKRDFTDYAEYFVPQVERAPFYEWSYGCTPTSAAMVLGYIDRTQNYGRLVDWFWQRYDCVEGEMDWQIPNTQRECAIAMHTDTLSGGTLVMYIAQGLQTVASNNGYTVSTISDQGGTHNDWAWNTITSEINSGHAFVWSVDWQHHSLACFGYRTPDKYVFIHNTWWSPGDWWAHSGNGWSWVDSPHPSGGDPHKLEITYPLGDTDYNSIGGGEVLQVSDTVDITWNNFGNPATKVDIDLSTDGGRTWQPVAGNVPDNGTYAWFIPLSVQSCDSARLRLRQYQGSTLTSGDGNRGCFHITREPMPPDFLAPPNGMQIFEPPIVLRIDSGSVSADSFDFRMVFGGDTIWREPTVVPRCSLPDTLFTYGRSYKWTCRAHNQFGWGRLGTSWSFWVRFRAGLEENGATHSNYAFLVPGINRLAGGVMFKLGQNARGSGLVIYNALGNRVVSLNTHNKNVFWNGRDQAGYRVRAGLYFVRLVSETRTLTQKFLLVE